MAKTDQTDPEDETGGVVRTSEENEALSQANGGTIVQAVGSLSASGLLGADYSISKVLEAAMVAEVEACLEEGITDPNVIRERKLAAHARKREEIDALVAEASAKASATDGSAQG